jgi:Spy/CpxP family protein refolding chaperone
VSTSPRAVAALLIAGALIAGIVVGVAGDRAYLWHTRQFLPRHPPRFISDRLVDHLDSQLHFTPQQKDAVKQIVERHRARIEAISANIRPQMRQEIESTNAEIEKVLNPEQRQKFQSLSQRMHQRHRGMRPGGPPPPVPSPH